MSGVKVMTSLVMTSRASMAIPPPWCTLSCRPYHTEGERAIGSVADPPKESPGPGAELIGPGTDSGGPSRCPILPVDARRRTRHGQRGHRGCERSGGPCPPGGGPRPPGIAPGIVLFAHGSGSSRHSPRNRFVAAVLQQAGLATLLADLLTRAEEDEDAATAHLR